MTVMLLGGVARLEHPLTNFDGERENHRRRQAERRLASYRGRVGEAFAFAFAFDAELGLKRAELAKIEVDLANGGDSADPTGLADDSRAAA